MHAGRSTASSPTPGIHGHSNGVFIITLGILTTSPVDTQLCVNGKRSTPPLKQPTHQTHQSTFTPTTAKSGYPLQLHQLLQNRHGKIGLRGRCKVCVCVYSFANLPYHLVVILLTDSSCLQLDLCLTLTGSFPQAAALF